MARKPTTTPRKRAEESEIKESIFDALGRNADTMNGGTENPVRSSESSDQSVTIATLLERIGEMKGQIDALSTREPVVVRMPETPKSEATKPQLRALPDVITDPDGYAAVLSENIAATIRAENESRATEQRTQSSQTSQYDQLFEDFAEQYPDLAEEEDRVEFVTLKVVDAAKKRGQDTNSYMLQNRDRFYKDIAREYERVFGEPETRDPPQRRGNPALDQDDSRSTSIFGGLESGASKGGQQKPPAGDMIKDLQDIQRKTGLY